MIIIINTDITEGKNEKNQLDFSKELAYDNYENDNQSQIRLRNVDKEKTIRRVI